MNDVKVRWVDEDSGNCRVYYRTIPNEQLVCLQDEGSASVWYHCIDDGCWNEPSYPINLDLNNISIVDEEVLDDD